MLVRLGPFQGLPQQLDDPVDAYRAALEERTRERVPLDWAVTQNNLGTALSALGEHTCRKDYLEIALESVKNASEVYLREVKEAQFEAYFEERISLIKAAIKRIP